jgi:glycosyltransferase involved in cell wall biosynthesis
MKAIQSTDPDNVKELADAVSHLVENRKERVRLGANGKRMLTEGQFSIRTRNERLRVIFEEAMRK